MSLDPIMRVDPLFYKLVKQRIPQDPNKREQIKKNANRQRRKKKQTGDEFYSFTHATRELAKELQKKWGF